MCEQQLSDMNNDQLFEKFLDELFISKDSPITKDCVNEIKTRLQSAARWVPVIKEAALELSVLNNTLQNQSGDMPEKSVKNFTSEIKRLTDILFDTVKLPEPPQG